MMLIERGGGEREAEFEGGRGRRRGREREREIEGGRGYMEGDGGSWLRK